MDQIDLFWNGYESVSLFNGTSNFVSYLIPKQSLEKDRSVAIWPIAKSVKGIQIWKVYH